MPRYEVGTQEKRKRLGERANAENKPKEEKEAGRGERKLTQRGVDVVDGGDEVDLGQRCEKGVKNPHMDEFVCYQVSLPFPKPHFLLKPLRIGFRVYRIRI